MLALVSELKERYPDRYVFINAPNIGASSEVQVLNNTGDWVVFQVPYDKVAGGTISEAIEVLGQDKVGGVVFTQ